MDALRLDHIATGFADRGTRRSAIGLSLTGLLASLWTERAEGKNKKKQRKRKRRCRKCDACERCKKGTCKLKAGRVRLENGSCAKLCNSDGRCKAGCGCSEPDAEGRVICQQDGPCDDLAVCTGTEDCPTGFVCDTALCVSTRRCTPLCGS